MYVGDFSPNVRPVPALRARVLAAQGRVGEALGWARERGLSADDDLSYLREFEHITLARVLLARYSGERAEPPLQEATRPPASASCRRPRRAAGRAASSRSWCCRRSPTRPRGDLPAALAPLERALTLAEPEGYVRVFVDEGPPMAALLRSGREAAGSPRATSAGSWPPLDATTRRAAAPASRAWSSR